MLTRRERATSRRGAVARAPSVQSCSYVSTRFISASGRAAARPSLTTIIRQTPSASTRRPGDSKRQVTVKQLQNADAL
jgi:hypothetical protein